MAWAEDRELRRQPLYYACWNGHVGCTVALLEHGAAVGAVDSLGRSPLHAACWNGHDAATNALLQAGADAAATDTTKVRSPRA